MAYFDSDVPKSLEIDENYTSRELYLFMLENENVMFLSNSEHLSHDDNGKKYRIVAIKDGFIHRLKGDGSKVHVLPNSNTKIIEII